MSFQIAVDVGGTFTDGVLLEDESNTIWIAKSLTTPSSPGEGIATVVQTLLSKRPEAAGRHRNIKRVVHGTTLIANTLLERKGAKIALVLTRGTADTLDIRREMRYDTYDLSSTFPDPLVPPELRFEVDERIGPDGSIWTPLDEEAIQVLANKIAKSDIAAVAICFLHACVNNRHENELAAVLRQAAPLQVYSLSSDIANEVGEFERMSTVAANAYVQPIVATYLSKLSAHLHEIGAGDQLDVMLSNGGFTKAGIAAKSPIHLIESGPAGGVLSAINCAKVEGIERTLAFDMGGTTAKCCVSTGGVPPITHTFEFARIRRFKKGSGHPAVSPSIDLIEIGAGGGSIAKLSSLGLLQVGPESAGSEPGPACYALGGEHATVTDADLILGYLDPKNFLGGRMELDVGRAHAALGRLGARLGLSEGDTARGIHDIVSENMAAAARTHIAEKGFDARDFTLVATGGAGPVHAVDVARRLHIKRILCPIASGVGSCLGFLAAPARADQTWSRLESIEQIDFVQLIARMQKARAAIVQELAEAQVASSDIRWRTSAAIRYIGQGASTEIDLGDVAPSDMSRDLIEAAFEESYTRLYGRLVPGGVPEVATWRVSGQSDQKQRRYGFPRDSYGAPTEVLAKERRIYIPAERCYSTVPVFKRHQLEMATQYSGPAVIEEPESTLVVSHRSRISILNTGTIQVDLED